MNYSSVVMINGKIILELGSFTIAIIVINNPYVFFQSQKSIEV